MANQVRLALLIPIDVLRIGLAYNLGNFQRRLALPNEVKH